MNLSDEGIDSYSWGKVDQASFGEILRSFFYLCWAAQ